MTKLHILRPEIEINGQPVPLPVRCSPIWTKEMGKRLMKARKWKCDRVDRRKPDWGHKTTYYGAHQCVCLSQEDVARQLCISQAELSKIETGKRIQKHVSIPLLYSVFGDILFYVLLGNEKLVPKGES